MLTRAEDRTLRAIVDANGNKALAAQRLRIQPRGIDYHLVKLKARYGTSGTVETLFRLGYVVGVAEVKP